MSELRLTERWDQWRVGCYVWPREIAWTKKVGLALVMAALTGLAAQVRIPLPFTPVPATGQVFAVLLSGVLLGGAWGGLSQTLYVALGVAGVPWFSGWAAGMPVGPTAGYLMGFIPAAALVGWLSDRLVWARCFAPQVALMMLGVAIIYVFGAIGFSLSTGAGLAKTIALAVVPFLAIDLCKAVAAAALSSALLPKETDERR
jgi:biotin transport system substrate-specific component